MALSVDEMIFINGKNETDSVASYELRYEKCDIVFSSSPRVYHYNRNNVRILKAFRELDPQSVILRECGQVLPNIERILEFEEFYRIQQSSGRVKSYRKEAILITQNCLCQESTREKFTYFADTAKALSLKTERGIHILEKQYARIRYVDETTALAKYLNPGVPMEREPASASLIYPFGINQSQKIAVRNAFSSQISIIQGPPGTGKTQTILNIIANAVRMGQTVAVVSNNNSATQNVVEKLEKYNLSYLTAFLGSKANKEQFIANQTGKYPDMSAWALSWKETEALRSRIPRLLDELTAMLDARNRIAQIDRELLEWAPEQAHFAAYYQARESTPINAALGVFPSEKLLSLWLEYEQSTGKQLGFFRKALFALRFGRKSLLLFDQAPEAVIPFVQNLYYQRKIAELKKEKHRLELQLKGFRFEEKLAQLRNQSMRLFRAELAQRYCWQKPRQCFDAADFRKHPDSFLKEYPIVLSTTYSIKGTLSPDYIYDYLIVDEASQVDLATGVLAFSCARNIVIVGDQKQLPNVLSEKDIQIADSIWSQYQLTEEYHFATHSMLASAAEIRPDAPSVLLREHYRCHPKIAGFFNQEFYNNQLIVMTEDHAEPDVLTMYRTAPGNHARGHYNQRQIDVIREEVLPKLAAQNLTDIGIITPYREQAGAIRRQLGAGFDVATVHKFQGREKDAIILTSVDNVIGEFVDDPNMLNVAVSRAVKSLCVIISGSSRNDETNYGDLARYIAYNNCTVTDSKVYSVFDLLYQGYYAQRLKYLRKHRRVSEFASENLAYSIIEKVLDAEAFRMIGCAVHASMAALVKDYSALTQREVQYASNPLTHLDFLLFRKMDKSPVMAIEVDGTGYHAAGSRQEARDRIKDDVLEKCGIALLRLRTNESGEEARIASCLHWALSSQASETDE